jgi:NAD(P)H-dependent FMN reductase
MSPVKLLTLSGSTRTGSFNTKLATVMTGLAEELGAEVTQIDLGDYPAPLFDPDWAAENQVPQSIVDLAALMQVQDAVFIAAPEYNSGVTPLLKNTMDWLSRLNPHPIKAPLFSLGAASPGALGGSRGLVSLRITLVGLGAIVMPEQLTVGGAGSAFNEDGSFAVERSEGFARAQLERLIEVAGKLKN